MKFLQKWPSRASEELSFRSIRKENSNCELISSVQHNRMLISSDALGKYHNYLYGAGVDIFPYDYLSDDEEKERKRMELLKSLCILASFLLSKEKTELFWSGKQERWKSMPCKAFAISPL